MFRGRGAKRGGRWSPDGDLYLTGAERGLIRLSEAGTREPVTELAPGEIAHILPDPLPGGRGVLFTVWPQVRNNWAEADIAPILGRARRAWGATTGERDGSCRTR